MKCDYTGMPHVVRLSDAAAADDLLVALSEIGADVRRRGRRTLLVVDSYEDLEAELLFFLRAWALSQPAAQFALTPA